MAKKLKDLVVTKVSLVPKGSNPDADVALFKEAVNKITYDEVIVGHPEGVREALWKIYDATWAFQNTVYANMMGGKNVVKDMEKSIEQFTAACMDALSEANITKSTKETADAIQAAVIAKAREFLATHVTEETTMKKREEMTKEELLAECARLEKAAPATEATPAAPTMADIMKMQDLPDVVKKALENQQAEITKAREEAAAATAIAKKETETRELAEMTAFVTKEMPNIPGKAEDIAKGLIEMKSKLSKENYDLVVQGMKAGSTGIAKANAEDGVSDVTAAVGSAYQKMDAIAKEKVNKDSSLTYEQAFAKTIDENPELYAEHRTAQRSGRREE